MPIFGIRSDFVVAQTPTTARQRLDTIIGQLQKSEIQKIDILIIPARIEMPISVTESDIENKPDYRIIIRDIRHERLGDSLIRALRSLAVEPAPDGGDLRWALSFTTRKVGALEAFFLMQKGRTGWSIPCPSPPTVA